MGGLWVRAERRMAAGAAPVCPVATPVDGAGGCTGVRAATLRGVLVFAVGTVGSGSVAEATGAVIGTAGNECAGGAPGHSGIAGAMLLGEASSAFLTASGCHSRMWSRAQLYFPPPTTSTRYDPCSACRMMVAGNQRVRASFSTDTVCPA